MRFLFLVLMNVYNVFFDANRIFKPQKKGDFITKVSLFYIFYNITVQFQIEVDKSCIIARYARKKEGEVVQFFGQDPTTLISFCECSEP
jgi:hypothetical protein